PEIPQNTGNIARTCAATGSHLHLVGKLGFSLEDKYMKRAGLDYWPLVDVHRHQTLEEYLAAYPDAQRYYLTTKVASSYADVAKPKDAHLVFGKETAGLPVSLLRDHLPRAIRIPMIDAARSLNLSNAVAIVCYEALRQQGFAGLQSAGLLKEG
nr:tRNA (cytidine(34)-2'-O)-methyltransferase [bacterium]